MKVTFYSLLISQIFALSPANALPKKYEALVDGNYKDTGYIAMCEDQYLEEETSDSDFQVCLNATVRAGNVLRKLKKEKAKKLPYFKDVLLVDSPTHFDFKEVDGEGTLTLSVKDSDTQMESTIRNLKNDFRLIEPSEDALKIKPVVIQYEISFQDYLLGLSTAAKVLKENPNLRKEIDRSVYSFWISKNTQHESRNGRIFVRYKLKSKPMKEAIEAGLAKMR
jgi:hypothetical protein